MNPLAWIAVIAVIFVGIGLVACLANRAAIRDAEAAYTAAKHQASAEWYGWFIQVEQLNPHIPEFKGMADRYLSASLKEK